MSPTEGSSPGDFAQRAAELRLSALELARALQRQEHPLAPVDSKPVDSAGTSRRGSSLDDEPQPAGQLRFNCFVNFRMFGNWT